MQYNIQEWLLRPFKLSDQFCCKKCCKKKKKKKNENRLTNKNCRCKIILTGIFSIVKGMEGRSLFSWICFIWSQNILSKMLEINRKYHDWNTYLRPKLLNQANESAGIQRLWSRIISLAVVSANKTSTDDPVMIRQRKPAETYCNVCEFQIVSRFKDWYKSLLGTNN